MKSKQELLQSIYEELLASWNSHDAKAYANLFSEAGVVVGFDGSAMYGQADIQKQLQQIFRDHNVSSYVSIVREIKQWSHDIFLVTTTVGMIPPGGSAVNPEVNAIQNMVVSLEREPGKILLFQNTPAAYHGRSEKVEQLTKELNEVAAERTVDWYAAN